MNQNVVYVSVGNVSREARRVCKEAAGIARSSSNKLHIDSVRTYLPTSLYFSLSRSLSPPATRVAVHREPSKCICH